MEEQVTMPTDPAPHQPVPQPGPQISSPQTGTTTMVAPPELERDEGEHDLFSHYVIGGGEAVMRAAITGEPVTALCGKTWVPSRDPKRYPICPTCEEIQAGRDPNLIDS